MQYQNTPANPLFRTMSSGNFLTGLGVGALVTLLVTNPSVQRAVFKTVARTSTAITSGLAEAKERFHDAEAEIEHEGAQEPEAT